MTGLDPVDEAGRPCFRPGAVVEVSGRVGTLTIAERVCDSAGAFHHYVAVDPDGNRYDVATADDPRLAATADLKPSPPGSRLAKPGGPTS